MFSKNVLIYISLALTLSLASLGAYIFLAYQPAAAQEEPLSTMQLHQISSTCRQAEGSLGQLQTNDALVRVNSGQAYESISTRLMKRFNARVAYNNLNNSALVLATTNYDRDLDIFRNAYREYDVTMGKLISIDCERHPASFYKQLELARQKRLNVRHTIEVINNNLKEYGLEVDNFEANYRLVAQNGLN